jgi:hypothetical protein
LEKGSVGHSILLPKKLSKQVKQMKLIFDPIELPKIQRPINQNYPYINGRESMHHPSLLACSNAVEWG